jgi:hypothetical protein
MDFEEMNEEECALAERIQYAHPFAILDIREQFHLLRFTRGKIQVSECSFRKLGSDWAHVLEDRQEVHGIQIDPLAIVKVNVMAFTLVRGDVQIPVTNVSWNQLLSLAWNNGWQPQLEEETELALHVKYETVERMEEDDAKSFAKALEPIEVLPSNANRIDIELVRSVDKLAAGGAFEIRA